jgi:hypothetical protein
MADLPVPPPEPEVPTPENPVPEPNVPVPDQPVPQPHQFDVPPEEQAERQPTESEV